jgi:hypothetical protein
MQDRQELRAEKASTTIMAIAAESFYDSSIVVPDLPPITITKSVQITTRIISPTEQPSGTDTELIAEKIAGSLQHSEYYKNYTPDYEIKTSLLGEPCNALGKA